MTPTIRAYLGVLRDLLVARLAGPLCDDEEDRYSDKLESYWRQMSAAEDREVRRLQEEQVLRHGAFLAGMGDVDVKVGVRILPRGTV